MSSNLFGRKKKDKNQAPPPYNPPMNQGPSQQQQMRPVYNQGQPPPMGYQQQPPHNQQQQPRPYMPNQQNSTPIIQQPRPPMPSHTSSQSSSQTGIAPPPPPSSTSGARELPLAQRSKISIIVGIDFGTTFSGVAYAFASDNEAKTQLLVEWPGATGTQQKIPTVLYYDRHGQVLGWGADSGKAWKAANFLKDGVMRCEWFKLHLQQNYDSYMANTAGLPPLPPGKSEIDVAADYLERLRHAMRLQMRKALGETFDREESKIKYVLTVPAIWNDAGKASTRKAAIKAGFLKDEEDPRMTLITEPEAAALFCAKQGVLKLKIQDSFLIVDCGGGTVDLIAYEVECADPFSVCESTVGSGDSCGATFLNKAFIDLLDSKIGKMDLSDEKLSQGKRVFVKCCADFDLRIKTKFTDNGEDWVVDVGLETDYPAADISDGFMTFTNAEIKQVFDPVMKRILQLVKAQIAAIEEKRRHLQAILVVGGFGASDYLFNQIKTHVGPDLSSKVLRPMDAWSAIVQGAVYSGIDDQIITHRVARRFYLMGTLEPFKEGYHPEQYRIKAIDGVDKCNYTRQIFVHRGQRMEIGTPVKVAFFRSVSAGSSLCFEDVLYACDNDTCPEYTRDSRIKEVCTLQSDLSMLPLSTFQKEVTRAGKTIYKIYFEILLTLDGSEMTADLVCQGASRGKSRVKFR